MGYFHEIMRTVAYSIMSRIALCWPEAISQKGFIMTKTWFITGASSGFGRILTEKLLARGDRVAATVRREHSLDDLGAHHGGRLWVAMLDVTDADSVRRVMDRAFAELGRIDVVVSNAGYGLSGAAEEVTDEQIRHQIDTNLVGSIAVIRACLPHLRAQGGGRVLQVSSEGGQITYPGFSLYHATKWGIEGFVEAVAKEVGSFGIALTLVEPGPTGTNFGAGLVRPQPMMVYDGTSVGEVRRALANGAFEVTGDADKMVDVMIAITDGSAPPLRLTLGSIAYGSIRKALNDRLAALEASKTITLSTDIEKARGPGSNNA
jgi:NAD(P)-dependent dehydrogenase (short-subunit alcohol dehydrogenase family)